MSLLHALWAGGWLRAMAEAHFEDLEPRHQSTQLRDRAAVGHYHAAYSTQRISTRGLRPACELTKVTK